MSDDMATSAAGLQAHLGVLACYYERSAIVVNTAKTKVLLAGARTAAAAAEAKAQAAGLTFAGHCYHCYIYLSSVFRSVWTTTELLFVSVGCGDGLWVGDWGGSRIPPLVPSVWS